MLVEGDRAPILVAGAPYEPELSLVVGSEAELGVLLTEVTSKSCGVNVSGVTLGA